MFVQEVIAAIKIEPSLISYSVFDTFDGLVVRGRLFGSVHAEPRGRSLQGGPSRSSSLLFRPPLDGGYGVSN